MESLVRCKDCKGFLVDIETSNSLVNENTPATLTVERLLDNYSSNSSFNRGNS